MSMVFVAVLQASTVQAGGDETSYSTEISSGSFLYFNLFILVNHINQ